MHAASTNRHAVIFPEHATEKKKKQYFFYFITAKYGNMGDLTVHNKKKLFWRCLFKDNHFYFKYTRYLIDLEMHSKL